MSHRLADLILIKVFGGWYEEQVLRSSQRSSAPEIREMLVMRLTMVLASATAVLALTAGGTAIAQTAQAENTPWIQMETTSVSPASAANRAKAC